LELTKGADVHITLWRVVGAALVLLIFVSAGGFVAFLVGDATHIKQAVIYGLGWEGTLGGFIQGTVRATRA
jgi:hypothetical protein